MFGSPSSRKSSSSSRRGTKYRSPRAIPIRPSHHVVTEWTKLKLLILLGGALILAFIMMFPLFLLLPDHNSHSTSAAGDVAVGIPNVVGLSHLMHTSSQIRTNWKNFIVKEEHLLEQELEQLHLIHHRPQDRVLPPETIPPSHEENQQHNMSSRNQTNVHDSPQGKTNAKPIVLSKRQEESIKASALAAAAAAAANSNTPPALIGAQRGHVTCEDGTIVDDLVYWNYPVGTRDLQFQTPFASKPKNHNDNNNAATTEKGEDVLTAIPKFLSFETDLGGWNNVRMALESILVFAAATGRTLVLPPSQPLYLLAMGYQGARTFGSFYDLDVIKARVKMITMHDFIFTYGQEILNLTKDELDTLQPLAKVCLHKDIEPETNCERIYEKIRPIGWQPPVDNHKTCVIFDEQVFAQSFSDSSSSLESELLTMNIPKDVMEGIKRFCGPERTPLYYNANFTTPPLIHWNSGLPDENRLLNHFYTTMHFTNAATDHYFKRLIRDTTHYKDSIMCAAGKIVHSLQQLAATLSSSESTSSFSSWHVRRGDFQYKLTRLSIEEWYNNSKDHLEPKELLYIATDEKNRTFFEPLTEVYGHPIRFLDDYYEEFLKDIDSTYLGMIDTIVASHGRTFTGTWFSTFTGYINRLRGYRGVSMKDSWYSWLPRKERMRTWEYPNGNYPAREWPLAWTGIDQDEWIEHEILPPDAHEENAESGLEREAGLLDANDEDEEDEDSTGEIIDRKVPKFPLLQTEVEQDTEFRTKPVARGVAGRPLSETPAMVGAQRAHVECEINVDSLAYWNDPQGDADETFKSPFRVEGEEKYISFGMDRGGWNNVRMSMEIIFIIALVSGRTLVLPPEVKLYLLHHDKGKQTRSFGDFFPLHTKEFAKRLKTISMAEFLEKEGGPNGRIKLPEGRNKTVVLEAADHCVNMAKADRSCIVLNGFLETVGLNPGFRAEDGCVVFDTNVYNGNDIEHSAEASSQHFCGKRNITFWSRTINDPTLLHFHADNKKYRLLTHFYSMIHFTDPSIDNYVKRFVRDFLHYHDSIYCAAGKIVKALQYEAKQRGQDTVDDEGAGGYSAMHIRRGDLQYKKVKLPASVWWNNTKELWGKDEILYIATDERNMSWFNPIAKKASIRFLSDYWDYADLGNLDPNYMGMIDTIVASRGRVFAGTWFSTFSGYINRMRGYHGMSMKDSWYSFLPRKDALHVWEDVDHYAYAYEWPTGWNGIDGDVVPSKDKF